MSKEIEETERWDDTTSTLVASVTSTSPTAYPSPLYTTNTLPPSNSFHTLLATNSQFVNIVLSPSSSPDSPLFYATNSQWSPSKPSVTLSRASKTGPVLGVLKLGWGAENVYGLGDPSTEGLIGGNPVRWEQLRRTSKWTHGTYEFAFRGRSFVWQRTGQGVFADQPDMECRRVEGGEVLAVYIGCHGWGRKRGKFYLIKGGVGVGGEEEKGGEDGWEDWEVVCLLTGLGIIEGARRRARQRRSGGGA